MKSLTASGETPPSWIRFAWTWGDHEVVGLEGDEFVQRDLVVAVDANVRPEFTEVLNEVVGEVVVVID